MKRPNLSDVRRSFLQAAAVLSVTLTLAAGAANANTQDATETEKNNEVYRYLNLFGDVFEKIKTDYVKETDDKEVIESAINGMLTSLDPHSGYLTPESFEDMRVQTKGEFGGLGIEVTLDNGFVKVITPIDDTPAAKAGLQAGDYITRLDGEQVLGMTLQDAVNKMRGEAGTAIKLTIQREGKAEPLEFKLTRAVIEVRAVRAGVYKNIGYIRVKSFTENTYDNLVKEIDNIKSHLKDKVDGYVLDLRNNPGGLLDQAVSVSDAFLEKGEIVSTRTRGMKEIQRYNADSGDVIDGKPLVVLINGGSASASEIVAGALKDHRRAVLIGTKSFGKGSVQTVMPLAGGGALRLTTALYYTPSGESIQAEGIVPDALVTQAELKTTEPGQTFAESDLPHHLINEKKRQEMERLKKENKDPIKQSVSGLDLFKEDDMKKDYQLKYAFDLVKISPVFADTLSAPLEKEKELAEKRAENAKADVKKEEIKKEEIKEEIQKEGVKEEGVKKEDAKD